MERKIYLLSLPGPGCRFSVLDHPPLPLLRSLIHRLLHRSSLSSSSASNSSINAIPKGHHCPIDTLRLHLRRLKLTVHHRIHTVTPCSAHYLNPHIFFPHCPSLGQKILQSHLLQSLPCTHPPLIIPRHDLLPHLIHSLVPHALRQREAPLPRQREAPLPRQWPSLVDPAHAPAASISVVPRRRRETLRGEVVTVDVLKQVVHIHGPEILVLIALELRDREWTYRWLARQIRICRRRWRHHLRRRHSWICGFLGLPIFHSLPFTTISRLPNLRVQNFEPHFSPSVSRTVWIYVLRSAVASSEGNSAFYAFVLERESAKLSKTGLLWTCPTAESTNNGNSLRFLGTILSLSWKKKGAFSNNVLGPTLSVSVTRSACWHAEVTNAWK